jgi:predicted ATPase
VVLTTHSADLVDYLEPSELRPMERGEAGDTVLHTLDKRQLVRWLKDFRLGQLWRMRRIGGVP